MLDGTPIPNPQTTASGRGVSECRNVKLSAPFATFYPRISGKNKLIGIASLL